MNPTEVVMPQMGQSVAEGTVIQWFKAEGDRIEKDEALLSITTDKIDVEIPSPGTGILRRVFVRAGETVPVGTPLATIEPDEAERPLARTAPPTPRPEPIEGLPDPAGWHSPAVLELAEREGLPRTELQKIPATGRGGRVTRQDVLAYLARRREGPAAEDEIVPFTLMRRAIAEHMVRSTHTAAHATAIIEVDMTAIAEYREREKAAFAERWGAPLTYLPFIIQASAKALRGHPRLNAWVYEDRIVLKREINVGLAVGLQDGLIVPVLRGVDGLGLGEIARQADDLARRAREKRLTPQEVQGGTFTVNNFGVSGILLATPIIVQPQAAILGIGAVTRRPTVAGSEVAVRALVYLCLSFDHRVIDGAVAGGFLQALRTALEGFAPVQE